MTSDERNDQGSTSFRPPDQRLEDAWNGVAPDLAQPDGCGRSRRLDRLQGRPVAGLERTARQSPSDDREGVTDRAVLLGEYFEDLRLVGRTLRNKDEGPWTTSLEVELDPAKRIEREGNGDPPIDDDHHAAIGDDEFTTAHGCADLDLFDRSHPQVLHRQSLTAEPAR